MAENFPGQLSHCGQPKGDIRRAGEGGRRSCGRRPSGAPKGDTGRGKSSHAPPSLSRSQCCQRINPWGQQPDPSTSLPSGIRAVPLAAQSLLHVGEKLISLHTQGWDPEKPSGDVLREEQNELGTFFIKGLFSVFRAWEVFCSSVLFQLRILNKLWIDFRKAQMLTHGKSE